MASGDAGHMVAPPSPLITEADDEEGGPSSVEAQADPNDLSFDLDTDFDIDVPAPTYPLVAVAGEPRPSTSNDIFNDPNNVDDQNPLADLFNTLEATTQPDQAGVKVEGATAGVCGFYNFANTCYMNSGLQCLLATPTVVKYFSELEALKEEEESVSPSGSGSTSSAGSGRIIEKFTPLLQDVWAGDYCLLKPVPFKECLSTTHPQFAGAHQHDCQEFLAVLLDTMHEELKRLGHGFGKNDKSGNYESECGTSMELHTAHSTDKDVGPGGLSMSWLSRHSSLDDHAGNGHGLAASVSGKKMASVVGVGGGQHNTDLLLQDGTESRGSASSPKSYDSHSSSVEDGVTNAIRQLPIPKTLKAKNPRVGGGGGGSDGEDSGGQSMDEDEISFGGHEDDDTMDSNASSANQPTSNLVAPDSLKRPQSHGSHGNVRFSDDISIPPSTEVAANNATTATATAAISESPVKSLNDFYQKENKTLNVNVLAEDADEMNNEISFDSEKFAKMEAKSRPRETIDNLNPSEDSTAAAVATMVASSASPSSQKVVNVKRLKTSNVEVDGSIMAEHMQLLNGDALTDFSGIKRMRLDSSEKEKNIQLEMERQQCTSGAGASALPPSSPTLDPSKLKEAIEADRFWEKHLAANDTVFARTFQGQFKSSVVCRACHYVSVNFEPFMYLPVPLPDASIRQVEVTYVSGFERPPTSLLLDMSHADNVADLKSKMCSELGLSVNDESLQVVEVLGHHISRKVEDLTMLKALKDDRKIYMVKVLTLDDSKDGGRDIAVAAAEAVLDDNSIQEDLVSSSDKSGDDGQVAALVPESVTTFNEDSGLGGDAIVPDVDMSDLTTSNSKPEAASSSTATATIPPSSSEYQSCVICMEDLPANELRQHNACDCVMCTPCLDRTLEHHQTDTTIEKGYIKCPGCRADAEPSVEFVTLDQIGKSKPKLRMLCLPVVCRLNQMDVSDNNKKQVVTFGHPTLISVPNQVSAKQLHRLLEPVMPFKNRRARLALVNAQGKLCSRCIFTTHCHGCVLIDRDTEADVLLQINDTIAITYTDDDLELAEANAADLHESMLRPRIKDKLTLDDCIEAFSRTEDLDESNPWYCPMCRKNQCATKTLTVWRFPDYLIIYLKRFVFMNTGALKLEKPVEFKTNDMDMTPYLSGPLQGDARPVFNMYGCVCHFGSVYGGHYTAFSRHLANNQWNHFDDGTISERKVPGDAPGDYSSAYILFFQRSGSKQDNQIPMLNRKCRAFAMDSTAAEKVEAKGGPVAIPLPPMNLTTNNEITSTATSNNSNNNANTDDNSLGLVDDDDEDDEIRPDLNQIIRSLDTPPPS